MAPAALLAAATAAEVPEEEAARVRGENALLRAENLRLRAALCAARPETPLPTVPATPTSALGALGAADKLAHLMREGGSLLREREALQAEKEALESQLEAELEAICAEEEAEEAELGGGSDGDGEEGGDGAFWLREEAGLEEEEEEQQEEEPVPMTRQQLELRWSAVLTSGYRLCEEARPGEFHQLVRAGVAPALRWRIWRAALGVDTHVWCNTYEELAGRDVPSAGQIRLDLARTFPQLPEFTEQEQERLGRLLTAFVAARPRIDYVQGMNEVAGLMLLVAGDEAEALRGLLCFAQKEDWEDLYGPDFPGLLRYRRMCLIQMRKTMPDLHAHFLRMDFRHAQYLDPWILSLMTKALPLQMATVAWDTFICEGLSNIVPMIISLLQMWRPRLLQMDLGHLTEFFRAVQAGDGGRGDTGGADRVSETELLRGLRLRPKLIFQESDEWKLEHPWYDFDDWTSPEPIGPGLAAESLHQLRICMQSRRTTELVVVALAVVAAGTVCMHAGHTGAQMAGLPMPILGLPETTEEIAERAAAPLKELLEDAKDFLASGQAALEKWQASVARFCGASRRLRDGETPHDKAAC